MTRWFQTSNGSAESRPSRSSLVVFLPLAVLFTTSCVSNPVSQPEVPPQEVVRERTSASMAPERPNSAPDYDVLVGEMAAIDGNFEVAQSAFLNAAQKDPESAHLQRRLAELSAKRFDLDGASRYGRRAMELDPEHEDTRIFLGRIYRNTRNLSAAREVLLREDGSPMSSTAGLLLFQMHLERNELGAALVLADQILEVNAEDLGGHMAAATVHERMGNLAEAEAALRDGLAHHPGRYMLYGRIARMRRVAGDRDGEIALYRELLALQPNHYGTLVSLAEAQVAQEDIGEAADTFSEIIETYPDDLQSVRRRAVLQYSLGRTDESRAGLEQALKRNPNDAELIYSLGQVRQGLEDGPGAIAAFQQIPADAESYTDARLHMASILEQQGDYPAALIEVERVQAIRPNRALRFHAASLRARTGDLEGGVLLLQEILDMDPGDHEALYQIGVLYGAPPSLQTDRALEYMNKALAVNPEHPQALNYIGYSLAERGERLDEAEEMILRALEHRPEDGYIIDSLGWVYYMRARPLLRKGRNDAANEYLEQARQKLYRAAELTGGDPVVSEHLGDVYLMLNDKPRALQFYREAVSLEHRAAEQPDLLNKLEGLRLELEGP